MNQEKLLPSYDATDKEVYAWLKLSKKHHIVFNRKRKRILEKRGEKVNYCIDMKAWLWVMK